MSTEAGVSTSVGAWSVALTMILFTLLYGALAVAEIKLTLRYAPVSYTHLDVYKRQVQQWRRHARQPSRRVAFPSFSVCRSRISPRAESPAGSTAVSAAVAAASAGADRELARSGIPYGRPCRVAVPFSGTNRVDVGHIYLPFTFTRTLATCINVHVSAQMGSPAQDLRPTEAQYADVS